MSSNAEALKDTLAKTKDSVKDIDASKPEHAEKRQKMLDHVADIEQKLAHAPEELQAKMAALKDAADKAGNEAKRMQDDKALDESPEKRAEGVKRLADLNKAAEDAAKEAQDKGEDIKQLAAQLDAVADAHDELEKEINPD